MSIGLAALAGGGGGGLPGMSATSRAESNSGPVTTGGVTFAPKGSTWQTVAIAALVAAVVLVVARGRG